MNKSVQLKQGVAAVVVLEGRFLVIERSQHVVAPGALCFPGGAVEPGETEADAVVREMREELGAIVTPLRAIWRSTTDWRVAIAWWQANLPRDCLLAANPQEVAAIHWLNADELSAQPNLLSSNREFLQALGEGEITFE